MTNPGRGRSTPEEEGLFLEAIKVGDLVRIRQMVQDDRDLLFINEAYYGSPVRAATDSQYPDVADYLARVMLQRLREDTIPDNRLYGAIHDLGEAAHSTTGFRGCDNLRAEAEPIVAGFLTHNNAQLRYIAVSVLSAHWDLRRYAGAFQQMSLNDPEDDVRQIALSSVGWLLRSTKDRDATRFLLSIFRDLGQDASMRQTAYEGLVEVWQGSNAATSVFVRMRRIEQPLGAKSRAGEEDKGIGSESRTEKVWEDVVDWEFVLEVEEELKNRT